MLDGSKLLNTFMLSDAGLKLRSLLEMEDVVEVMQVKRSLISFINGMCIKIVLNTSAISM